MSNFCYSTNVKFQANCGCKSPSKEYGIGILPVSTPEYSPISQIDKGQVFWTKKDCNMYCQGPVVNLKPGTIFVVNGNTKLGFFRPMLAASKVYDTLLEDFLSISLPLEEWIAIFYLILTPNLKQPAVEKYLISAQIKER